MARMTLKPKAGRSTLLLCAGGSVFAVIAIFSGVATLYGVSTQSSPALLMALAAAVCAAIAFLPSDSGQTEDRSAEIEHTQDEPWWGKQYHHDECVFCSDSHWDYTQSDLFDD